MSDIRHITSIPGFPASTLYSPAVVAGGLVYVSGQTGMRKGGTGPIDVVGPTIQEQTRQALANVDAVLRAAGSSLDRAVKVLVMIANPDDFKGMNEAYAEAFPGAKPTRSVARLGPNFPGVLVLIEAVALA
ncbi:MAG: RidA family protein [Alphaproteobacteria bacterium]|nr:RidA family protein [Alphaproteobacteria bacterium]